MSTANEIEEEVPEEVADDMARTGEMLLKQCSKVRVRISWFSTSAQVDGEMKMEMLEGTEADKSAVSISKKFLNTRHDALEAVKQARASIQSYVQGMTIPMLALRSGDDAEAGIQKDAGIRLIRKSDMEEFDRKIRFLIGVLGTAVEGLQKAMPEIMAMERKTRGRLFDPSDYPTNVTRLVGVSVSYEPAGVDVDWEQLCPEIYKRESLAARQKFALVAENAAVEFAKTFTEYVSQVVEQLGNRVRLNPVEGPEWARYKDAEVLETVDHDADPDVPRGHVLVKVRLRKGAGVKGKSEDVWMDEPIRKDFYHDKLRPRETGEKKKLYASTVENLKAQLERFLNIGDMLGPYRDVIHESVDRVKQLLVGASRDMDSGRIAEELRGGEYLRNQMRSVLAGVKDTIQDSVAEMKVVRRKVTVMKRKEADGA